MDRHMLEHGKIKAGIIGCGAIGGVIAEAILNRFACSVELLGVCDADENKARALIGRFNAKAKNMQKEELIDKCGLVIEAAAAGVSYEIAKEALIAGKNVIIMSTGGLLGRPDIFEIAKKSSGKLYLPSGAIAGLDGLKSAMIAGVRSATLTTRKPPEGLKGAPYIREKNVDLDSIKKETVIFEGTAEEAVKGFPQNVNVSATLSLCGIGPKNTKVRIVTSPDYAANIHEVEIEGDFGRLKTVTQNVPMPSNPKTSYLAALSAIAVIDDMVNSVRIGN